MNKIKNLRKKFGYSQQKLVEMLGGDLRQSTISSWETGRCAPPQRRLSQLAQIFGVSEEELMADTMQQISATPELLSADSIEGDLSLTETEKHLLDCFRSVDESGKRMILSVADLEYERRRNEIVG